MLKLHGRPRMPANARLLCISTVNDIRNNNRDVNVCNCTNENANRNASAARDRLIKLIFSNRGFPSCFSIALPAQFMFEKVDWIILESRYALIITIANINISIIIMNIVKR